MGDFITKIQDNLAGYFDILPGIIKVLAVLLIGWLIARALRKLVIRLLRKSRWDEKLFGGRTGEVNTGKFLGNLLYYLIMIIVLMIALEMMGVSYVLDPLKNMLGEFFNFIPNLAAAGILGFIGYILAKFVSNLFSMGGALVDRIVDKTGFKDTDKLVSIIKKILFFIIFIPFIILALNALELDAITEPVNKILSDILDIIPNLLGAVVIIAIFLIGGKFLSGFLGDLLRSLGVDSAADKLQLTSVIGQKQTLSKILAGIAFFFLAFFGIITGIELLHLDQLTEILNRLLTISGQILFGLIILVFGNYISKLIYNALSKSESNKFVASVVRIATLGLFLAMALRAMNIAPDIVDLAFGLTLGAIAVVIALAYGLGGREAAGEHFRELIDKFRKKKTGK